MRALLPALILSTLAAPSLASDGVLEINQTCAESSGCFATDSAGFPVSITERGSYRLTSNLTVPDVNTTAIDIAIDGVSVDLNGFAILGPVTCTGVPIASCSGSGTGAGIKGLDHVTVKNGMIRGMGGDAISLAWDARIEKIQVVSNNGSTSSTTGAIAVGDESIISETSATSNGKSGISTGNYSIVDHSTAIGNRYRGIHVGDGSLITGCTASKNGVYGLSFPINSTRGGYSGNVVNDNGFNSVDSGRDLGHNLCDGSTLCP